METQRDAHGNCTAYTCHFQSMAEGEEAIRHQARIVWHETQKGWASLDEEPNAFYTHTFPTVAERANTTLLIWEMYFEGDSEEII